MSDNYTGFSERLKINTEAEREWVEAHFKTLGSLEDSSDEAGPEAEKLAELYELEEWEHSLDFDWNFEDGHLSIYSEESGNVNNAATFVQLFLKEFYPEDHFHISWANWCSKSSYGEFGGGAVFITAESMDWISSYDFIQAKLKEFSS